jgi:hypothetical protein
MTAAKGIGDPVLQSNRLAQLVEAAKRLGHSGLAAEALRVAIAVIGSIPEKPVRFHELARAMSLAALLADEPQVVKIASQIEDQETRARALAAAASVFSTSDPDAAIRLADRARSMADGHLADWDIDWEPLVDLYHPRNPVAASEIVKEIDSSEAYVRLAQLDARSGRLDEASAHLNSALDRARKIEEDSLRSQALVPIAAGFASIGDYTSAVDVVDLCSLPDARLRAAAAVLRTYAKGGASETREVPTSPR